MIKIEQPKLSTVKIKSKLVDKARQLLASARYEALHTKARKSVIKKDRK